MESLMERRKVSYNKIVVLRSGCAVEDSVAECWTSCNV